jgi:hypothetical protein
LFGPLCGVGRLRGVSGFAVSGPVNGFRGRPAMDLAPLSSTNVAPSTAEPLACRSMNSASSARPPDARVRRTSTTTTEGLSVFGARWGHRAPRGQNSLPVSELLALNWVFDFPQEKPETGPFLAMPSPRSQEALTRRSEVAWSAATGVHHFKRRGIRMDGLA